MDLEGAWSGVGSLDDLSLLGRNMRGRCKWDGVSAFCKSGIGLGQGCLGYKDRSKEGSRARHCWVHGEAEGRRGEVVKDGREAANRKTAKARVRMREGVRA